ncbi:MAG: hypothetical protein ACR2OU_10175 [Thermomicrobiales bacterium]
MTRRTIERVPSALVALVCTCVLVGMMLLAGGGFGLIAQDARAAQSVIDPDVDSDGDGIMNSHDPDDDNDGIPDDIDADPFDPNIPGVAPTPNSIDPDADSDGDGIMNSHDPDDDNDAAPDKTDPDPFDRGNSSGGTTQPEVPSSQGATVSHSPQVAIATNGNTNTSARGGLITKLPNTGHGLGAPVTPSFMALGLALIAVMAACSGFLVWVASRFDGYGLRR